VTSDSKDGRNERGQRGAGESGWAESAGARIQEYWERQRTGRKKGEGEADVEMKVSDCESKERDLDSKREGGLPWLRERVEVEVLYKRRKSANMRETGLYPPEGASGAVRQGGGRKKNRPGCCTSSKRHKAQRNL